MNVSVVLLLLISKQEDGYFKKFKIKRSNVALASSFFYLKMVPIATLVLILDNRFIQSGGLIYSCKVRPASRANVGG